MTDAKRSFILYYSINDIVDKLDDHQVADLFRAILATGGVREMPTLDPLTDMAFTPIKRELEENAARWEDKKAKRAEAGRKGGSASKKAMEAKAHDAEARQANEANAIFACDEKAKVANQAVDGDVDVDGDGDVDGVNNKSIVCPSGDGRRSPKRSRSPSSAEVNAHFEELWALVPRKEGKASVKDSARRKLLGVSVDEMSRAVERYKAQVRADRDGGFERKWLMGSTWFNEERWRDYAGDDYTPPEPQESQVKPSARSQVTRYRAPGEVRDWSSREE